MPPLRQSRSKAEPDPLLDFEILEEKWSDYELEDGSIIRIRPILLILFPDRRRSGRKGMRIGVQSGVWSPSGLLGKRGKPEPVEILQKNVIEDNLLYKLLAEGQSRYRTSSELITMRVTINRFQKTSLFDHDRQPQYVINQYVETEIRSIRRRKN